MKSKILMLLALLQLCGFSAFAKHRDVDIKTIQLTNLRHFSGQKVSLFTVSGHRAPIVVPGSWLVVHEVIGKPQTVTIDANGVAEFKGFHMKRKDGFFNNLAFVVHPMGQNDVFIRNPDGKLAADPRLDPDAETAVTGEQMGAIYINTLLKRQGKGQTKLSWTNLVNGS